MRYGLIFLLLGLSVLCSAQRNKKVQKLNLTGVICYKFIPDIKFVGYYCSLKPTINIDSSWFDFIPTSSANYHLLKKNPEFSIVLGIPENYNTNLETYICIYKSQHFKNNVSICDSVIKEYKTHNIYDSAFYKPDYNENMTENIYSNSIFKIKNSDTLCISFSFTGTVLKYENVGYDTKTNYQVQSSDNDTRAFNVSHGLCSFEKYNTTFMVVDKVDGYKKISKHKMEFLGLVPAKLTLIKVILYE